jgi:ABC-2 type transport system permease protein
MFRNLFIKTLYDYRYALLGWAMGFVFISLYIMYFYPFISDKAQFFELMDNLPPIVKNLLGDRMLLQTPEGFLSIQPFSMMAPLMFLVFAIQKAGDAIAGEKERNTLDLLLAQPVPRYRLVIEKWSAIAVSLFLLSLVFWLSMILGSVVFNISVSSWRLAGVILSGFILGLFFSSLTLFLSCIWLHKKLVIGIVSGFALVTYLVNAYGPMVTELHSYRVFSPFYYYNGANPLLNGLNPGHFLILVFFVLLFFILTILFFKRSDLA